MCGIAGIYNLANHATDVSSIKSMCDVMAYRGPDDAGYLLASTFKPDRLCEFSDDNFLQQNTPLDKFDLALGHRRLSIIDISSAGHQPMCNQDRNIWIVYNGEIYNYRQLRDNLIAKGYKFRSQTDTEVILYSYQEYGQD